MQSHAMLVAAYTFSLVSTSCSLLQCAVTVSLHAVPSIMKGIRLLCLHCSSPAFRSFQKSFAVYFTQALRAWIFTNLLTTLMHQDQCKDISEQLYTQLFASQLQYLVKALLCHQSLYLLWGNIGCLRDSGDVTRGNRVAQVLLKLV